jgi:type I restriction enzyme S subunit
MEDGRLDYDELAWRSYTAAKLISKRLKRGDILLERSGGGPDQPVGRVGYFDRNDIFGFSNFMQRLRAQKSLCLGKFLFYQLWALHAAGRTAVMQHATTGIRNLDFNEYLAFRVPVPPFSEQARIVEMLECCGSALVGVEELLKRKLTRRKGLMQQLLTGRTRFEEFKAGSWRTVRIGSLLEECDRYVTWSNDAAYRFASIRRRSGGLFDRGTSYGREVKTKVLKLLKAGDFVISKRQVVHGAWAMVTRPFDGFGVSDEYDVLVNRDPRTLDMRFFNYLSQTRRLWHVAYLASNGVHIEKLIFDYDDFAKEKVKIPPTVEEQARIVEVLSACDREIVLLQKQLEALKDQKRGLMQKLLTGQVRVKTEVLKAGNGRRKAGIPNDEDSTANIEVRPGKSAKE